MMKKVKDELCWTYKCTTNFSTEAKFTTWFQKQRDWFIYKISDQSAGYKPFDCFGMYKWVGIAVELKVTPAETTHPFRLLSGATPSHPWAQVESLKKRQEKGWLSLVVVYSKKSWYYSILDFKDIDFNTKIKIKWDQEI